MRQAIERRLDLILEDGATVVDDDPYQNAMNIAADLDNARRRVAQLERELIHATDRLCGGLAMGIRKAQPSLNVNLGNGACQVNYRKKNLRLKPDLTKRMWLVDSNRQAFGNRFRRHHGHVVGLSSDLTPLADAIASYFADFYKSIGKDLAGRGSSVVEGRQVTLGELACLVRAKDKILREIKPQIW
jgi:hypothetical protein